MPQSMLKRLRLSLVKRRWLLRLVRRIRRRKQSVYASFSLAHDDRYIDFTILLNPGEQTARQYKFSKVYFTYSPDQDFHEDRVICFEPRVINSFTSVRLCIPSQALDTRYLELRVDGLPDLEGTFKIRDLRLTTGLNNADLTREAELIQNRQWVRKQVIESEREKKAQVIHYPESISLELTAKCNLRCPHCSSHGTEELHIHHNRRSDISIALLEKIGHELFPHITALSLVGRGEPMMAHISVWQRCMDLVMEYGVKTSIVTNGHYIHERLPERIYPYLDELCVSLDGASQEVHGQNRGGSNLETVMNNVEQFHSIRSRLSLARRPTLSIYWTLMENNIHELPQFIRDTKYLEIDYFSIRHLVVFHDKNRESSLIGKPHKTNHHLREAYDELDRLGIRYEAPPLTDEAALGITLPPFASNRKRQASAVATDPGVEQQDSISVNEQRKDTYCTWMHRTGIIMSDGEVITCGKHYGEQIGNISGTASFWDIWNGPGMSSLRCTFGTSEMWEQCKKCWLRELRWHEQRAAKNEGLQYSDPRPSNYSIASWDYRDYDAL